jgi:16S rRNA (uracil1498-N3)-methyltransferase
MARIWFNGVWGEGDSLDLGAENAHYLRNVMRIEVGEDVFVFNKDCGEWKAEITLLERQRVIVKIYQMIRHPIVSREGRLILVCPLVRNVSSSFVVQKASELGVDVILPIIFERSVVNKLNKEKLLKIAIESAEQCERLSVLEVGDFLLFQRWIGELSNDTKQKTLFIGSTQRELGFFERENGMALDNFMDSLELERGDKGVFSKLPEGCDIYVIVGPEGGFSKEEMKVFVSLSRNNTPLYCINIEDTILRSETAIISTLTLAKRVCGQVKIFKL